MARNQKEIELFGEKLILSERLASDVLAFSEFVKNNSDEKTVGLALYQASLIVESGLKVNKKEIPEVPKATSIWQKIIRWLGLDKAYKEAKKIIAETIAFNLKLLADYILNNLTQKEIFDLVKQVYELEGINIEKQSLDEKKS